METERERNRDRERYRARYRERERERDRERGRERLYMLTEVGDKRRRERDSSMHACVPVR